jgi:DNA-binding LacI/PurR family transcriptional regulator
VELGHRHIALIEGGAGIAARTRHEGYLRAMRRLGLDECILTVKGAHSEEGGRSGAHKLLRIEPFPTAIFASNDLCAIGALDVLEDAGLTIPNDVSLVGFDNTTLAALRHISLTSINQPGSDMGMSAVECLWERIQGERTSPRHDVVAPSLVVRSTTGPPRDTRQSDPVRCKPVPSSHHPISDE